MQTNIHIVMPSVENFYWILFENLLKPLDINCYYYHPWGTKDHVSMNEFLPFNRTHHMSHALFHFDQEPIWQIDLGLDYEATEQAWVTRWLKILANSEHSELKKQVLQDRQMMDWYFFYHGFAALDWYRDTRYISIDHGFNNAFLSFNHLVTGPRAYRLDLIARLIDQGAHTNGTISLHATGNIVTAECNDQWSKLTHTAKNRVTNMLLSKIDLPLVIDHVTIDGDLSAHCGHREYRMWQSSLWHIVNETVFYEPKLHLTEKIFKPIVSKRPFILVGAPNNLAYLRSYGFKTFSQWIDESYDSIDDSDLRLQAIASEIARISQLSASQLQNMHREMQSLLKYNKEHFFTTFREKIVDELLLNFETSIRVWNNGRIDGHEVPLPMNLHQVRKVMLQ